MKSFSVHQSKTTQSSTTEFVPTAVNGKIDKEQIRSVNTTYSNNLGDSSRLNMNKLKNMPSSNEIMSDFCMSPPLTKKVQLKATIKSYSKDANNRIIPDQQEEYKSKDRFETIVTLYPDKANSKAEDFEIYSSLSKVGSELIENYAEKFDSKRLDSSYLMYINLLRTNPIEFSKYIDELLHYTHQGVTYIEKVCYIKFKNESTSIENCSIELLSRNSIFPLEFRQNLCIDFPPNDQDWIKREYLTDKLKEISSLNQYNTISFHYEKEINNPIVSIINQIIDDGVFRGTRKAKILGHEFKYLGVSSKVINSKACVYFIFAN